MKRSGSDLFNRPSGFAVSERMDRRGLGESLWLSVELAIESIFTAFRSAVTAMLFLRSTPRGATTPQSETTAATAELDTYGGGDEDDVFDSVNKRKERKRRAAAAAAATAPTDAGLRRTRSFGSWEDMGVWTASDVILQAGYPLEEHVVTTSDGYILTMQRIPRKDSKEVVFFMHGILDTSLGWVSNGTQGSQAFAAYDRGADVFLGNCRANPPRAHADASRGGAAYWCYSINELGMEDVAAQVYRIHAVKTAELGSGPGGSGFNMASVVGGGGSGNDGGGVQSEKRREKTPAAVEIHPSPRVGMHKRSGSDSALAAIHNMNIATERLASEEGAAASAPPNEQQIKAHNLAAAAAKAKAEVEEMARKTNSIGSSSSGGALIDSNKSNKAKKQQQLSTTTTSLLQPKSRFANLLGHKLGRTHSGPIEVPGSASPKAAETHLSADNNAVGATSSSAEKTKPLRRRASLSKLILGGGGRDASTESSPRSAVDRVKSFKLPDPVHEDEEGHAVPGSSPPVHASALLKSSPFQQEKEQSGNIAASGSGSYRRPPPLQLPNDANASTQLNQQQQQVRQRAAASSSRAPTPDLPMTPADSTECTPRCAAAAIPLPQVDRLMTPDRVSVGGREQAPLQWAVKIKSTGSGSARRSMSTSTSTTTATTGTSSEPYHLQAVGHSLGGAALIIYAVMCKVLGRQHHLSRLVLLTPGGFHRRYPKVALPFIYILPVVMKMLNYWRPGVVRKTE